MDQKQLIQSYRDELNKWRLKVIQLEVGSIEQRASDEVSKWRSSFDTLSSSKQIEQVLDELEKKKQAEVSHLANELRNSLAHFKEILLSRLDKLDSFISSINLNNDNDPDHIFIKDELDSIVKQIDSLRMDVVVQVINNSKGRRLSTPLARNTLELVKVFDFNNSKPSSTDFFGPLRTFVRRASISGASYYNNDILDKKTYF